MLVALYAAFSPLWLGIPGTWCTNGAQRAACFRDWLGALSGWAAAAGALVAAKIAYDALEAARTEAENVESRHQKDLDLRMQPKREALKRAYTGFIIPLERALNRTVFLGLPAGFGGLGGLGGAPTGDPNKALEAIFNEVRELLDSKAYTDVLPYVSADVQRPALRVRKILDGEIPPIDGILGMIVADVQINDFTHENRRRLSGIDSGAKAIVSVIRQEAILAGIYDEVEGHNVV